MEVNVKTKFPQEVEFDTQDLKRLKPNMTHLSKSKKSRKKKIKESIIEKPIKELNKIDKDLIDLREKLHDKILYYRKIETAIANPRFKYLWEEAPDGEQKTVSMFIMDGELFKLDDWIRNHPSYNIGEIGTRKLKNIARKLGIKNYCRMTRVELINNIKYQQEKKPK